MYSVRETVFGARELKKDMIGTSLLYRLDYTGLSESYRRSQAGVPNAVNPADDIKTYA
jgi:hypothetical protein